MPNSRENQYGALEFTIEAIRQKARMVEKPIGARSYTVSKKGEIKYGYHLLRTIVKQLTQSS